MPRCALLTCEKEFLPDPHNPRKRYCNRKCAGAANALARKGTPCRHRYPKTSGQRGNTGIRRDVA